MYICHVESKENADFNFFTWEDQVALAMKARIRIEKEGMFFPPSVPISEAFGKPRYGTLFTKFFLHRSPHRPGFSFQPISPLEAYLEIGLHRLSTAV